MKIEKALCPKEGKLVMKNGIPTVKIVDEDLDIIDCIFVGDCVEIDTEKYKYITLNLENLLQMIDFIEQSQTKLFRKKK
jgi:hypothetical protein